MRRQEVFELLRVKAPRGGFDVSARIRQLLRWTTMDNKCKQLTKSAGGCALFSSLGIRRKNVVDHCINLGL